MAKDPTTDTSTPESRGAGSQKVIRHRYKTAQRQELARLAKLDYDAAKTPEHRALKLRDIRQKSAITGAVLMAGLGAWSATGIHKSVAGDAAPWTPDWILGWILEPILLLAVALIVIVRSLLATVGARLSGYVWFIEVGILSLSVAANIDALPPNPDVADYVMRLTGPIGCLLISIVMVLIEQAIQRADTKISADADRASASRWTGVRDRLAGTAATFADTAATVADRTLHTVADRIATPSTDTEADRADTAGAVHGHAAPAPADTPASPPQSPADTRADSPAQAGADTSVDADTPVRAPLSATVTSADIPADSNADTRADSPADTAGAVHGPAPRPSTDTLVPRPQPPADTRADSPAEAGADADTEAPTEELPAVRVPMNYEEALAEGRVLGAEIDTLSVRTLATRIGCGRTTAGHVRNAIIEERSRDADTEPDDDLTENEHQPDPIEADSK